MNALLLFALILAAYGLCLTVHSVFRGVVISLLRLTLVLISLTIAGYGLTVLIVPAPSFSEVVGGIVMFIIGMFLADKLAWDWDVPSTTSTAASSNESKGVMS